MNFKIFRKFFLLLSLSFLFLGSAFGQNISITSVKLKEIKGENSKFRTRAEIVFNNAIKVRGILVANISDKVLFKFPEYISAKKQTYPQLKLLTAEANEVVRKALETREPQGSSSISLKYRIAKFKKISSPSKTNILASVVFNESIEIECKVIEGKNGPWVLWPSEKRKDIGRWRKQIVITDYSLRESVERDLIERYNKLSENII
ncbi:MAG: septation protein SpoVG family protein [Elusimicrobia bacterium]|nr:septation protein SpoVG family protein [Elusimicrobiota bacterium]